METIGTPQDRSRIHTAQDMLVSGLGSLPSTSRLLHKQEPKSVIAHQEAQKPQL